MSLFTILLAKTDPGNLDVLIQSIQRLYTNTAAFDTTVNAMVLKTIAIGETLCLLFIPLSIGWNVISKTVDNLDTADPAGKWMWNWKEMGRLILLYTLLNAAFIPLCTALIQLSNVLEGITFTGAVKEYEVASESTTPSGEFTTDNINGVVYGVITNFIALFAKLVSYIVYAYAYCVSRILYVLGPLAVAFSILPPFKDRLSGWFGMFLSCLCVPFTVNIINGIYQNMIAAMQTGGLITPALILVLNTIYIMVICLAFWFTSFYIGYSGASKALSVAVATTSALVSQGLRLINKGGGSSGNPIEK